MKSIEYGVSRIIDANLNRSREGLRVCEEVARFILNSSAHTEELKAIRHKITSLRRALSAYIPSLLDARNVEADVLRPMRRHKHAPRHTSSDVFAANIQRVKESLRVLEEFSAIFDARSASTFESLRFKAYEIEKKVLCPSGSLRYRR